MFSVKLIKQFRCIPEILRWFPRSLYVMVTHPLYEIMQYRVALLRVEDPGDHPSVRVVDDHRLRFRRHLGCGRRCIAVKQ